MKDDTVPIYEQLENEPDKWYERFACYRDMPDRSLLGAYRLYWSGKGIDLGSVYIFAVPSVWRETAEKYDWQFRAELYDQHQQQKAK